MLSVSKPASLIEQKKQQWAREREEMSHLYLPWGSGTKCNNNNRLQIRNQFASTLELHKQSSYEYQEPIPRQRSPSLPPIHHIDDERPKEEKRSKETLNRNIPTAKRFAFYDEDGEGDTSGYGSETINHMNIRHQSRSMHEGNNDPIIAWHQNKTDNRNRSSSGGRSGAEEVWSARSPRSAADEGRPRWGDRGVATGRLWEPTAPTARLPQMPNQKRGTPSWVERGLNMIENTAEVIVIDQTSSTNSGFDDRSSCNGSDEGKTFLRGQNVPIEPEVKAQRENRRMKALELQSAILNQLEEQEKRRQEEKERKLREERLEEMRIRRQQEEDRMRLEQEKRKIEEKQLQEQRKLEMLKKALDDAERKAKQDKEKKFSFHKPVENVNTPFVDINTKIEENACEQINKQADANSPIKSNRTFDVYSEKSKKIENDSQQTTEFNSPRSIGPGNLNLFIHNVPPLSLTDNNQFSILPIGINGNGDIINGQSNNIQLAVLVPQNISNNLYSLSLNSLNNINEPSETEKTLTPRKYRTLVRTKDAYTQTEISLCKSVANKIIEAKEIERDIDKDYSNIDENAPQDSHSNTLKKDRRFRSEERYKKELETRPKWGVNRPAAQYKKQSEKDPFYSQKRKIRQKHRPARQYLSQSSEDSRSPSPPSQSDKIIENINNKPRNTLSQSYWRNKRSVQDAPRNNVTTETINSVQEILGQMGVNEINEDKKSPKSPTKRMTLSQKFINDKYGNRKLWMEDVNDKNVKPNNNIYNPENRKKIIELMNLAKRDYMERQDD